MHFVLRWAVPAAFYSLLLYTGLLLFSVTFGTVQPGLDPSWAYALNKFAHGPEIFGKDIVLTYGPLGYLAVPEHVGNNLKIALWCHIALWLLLVYLLELLWDSGKNAGAIFFCLGLIFSNKLYADYWDYLITAAILTAFAILLKKPDRLFVLIMIPVLIGTAFLVKFTGYITGMTLLSFYIAGRVLTGEAVGKSERYCFVAAVFSGPLAYLIYHPSLSGFTGYLRGSLEMASGYSTTMSLPVPPDLARKAVVLIGITAACAAICLWKRWISLACSGMIAAIILIAFKHGYVRSEIIHASIFFTFMILVFAFLASQIPIAAPRTALLGVVFVGFSATALQWSNEHWPVWSAFWWSPSVTLRNLAEFANIERLQVQSDQLSEALFRKSPIEGLLPTIYNSRALIFPMDLSSGSRGHFHLVPLFGTQAYTTYTSYLDRRSAENISNASPPIDYIVFGWQAIDGRNLLVDVPQTWNAIYCGFVPASEDLETFLLRPRTPQLATSFNPTGAQSCPVNTWIPVPRTSTPLALTLKLNPKPLGKLATTFFQLGVVDLRVQTRAGVVMDIRIPPDVVSSPFPLNYLPLTSAQLRALWKENIVQDPIVRFQLTGPGLDSLRCDSLEFHVLMGTGIRI